MGTYTRNELLQLRDDRMSNFRLPQTTWRTIVSLDIVKDEFQPTHRGCRAGVKVKKKLEANKAPHVSSCLNVCHWNAQSIRNKTTTCSELIIDHNVDLMFLTETWLGADSDQVVIGELTLPGFNFINLPRPTSKHGGHHGGIGILHRCSVKLQTQPSDFVAESFEHAIIFDNVRKIHFVVIYRPLPQRRTNSQLHSFSLNLMTFSYTLTLSVGRSSY
jgi:hypothetical protein